MISIGRMNPFSRSQAAAVVLLSLLFLSLYGWSHYTQHGNSTRSPQLLPRYVFVQVTGKVHNPGIYSFDQPVTVSQVVARAGGLLPPLGPMEELKWAKHQTRNAGKIHIMADPSGVASLRPGWMAVPTRLALGVPLDINRASVDELALVPGINEQLAERIVALRGSTGGFLKLEDIRAVKGIGPATVRRLRPYLTVGTKQ